MRALLIAGALATGVVAAPPPAHAAGYVIDRTELKAACLSAATRAPPPIGTEIARVATDQWAKFGYGRVKETAADAVIEKQGTAPWPVRCPGTPFGSSGPSPATTTC
uniref:Uncharacterized protein n=1 Tax=Phenylobacterium glaciei TaxID=2803784 RepID=A0A974P3R8_9CAUL|nr:hypothetical protein JKL49_27090 [Phenylobacterium glaciei]